MAELGVWRVPRGTGPMQRVTDACAASKPTGYTDSILIRYRNRTELDLDDPNLRLPKQPFDNAEK